MWAEGQSWAVPLHVPMPNPDTRLHLLSASALAPASSQHSLVLPESASLWRTGSLLAEPTAPGEVLL